MNSKKISLLILAILTLIQGKISGQEETEWFSWGSGTTLKYANVESQRVEGFSYLFKEDGYDLREITPLMNTGHILHTREMIASNDGNFCMYIKMQPIASVQDSVNLSTLFYDKSRDKFSRNELYKFWIELEFRHILKEKYESLDGCPLTYLSSDYAKESFNADDVLYYPIELKQPFEGKYNHCYVIYITKKEIGIICLYCLFNNEAIENEIYYKRGIEGMFRFKDLVAKGNLEISEDEIEEITFTLPPL